MILQTSALEIMKTLKRSRKNQVIGMFSVLQTSALTILKNPKRMRKMKSSLS